MAEKQIKIKLLPDGTVQMHTEGIKGKSCIDYAKMLEEKFYKPKNKYEYLLKGLVYCGHCKARMQYKYRTRTKISNKYRNSRTPLNGGRK